MQTFKSLKVNKLRDADFRDLFEKECHVCRITLSVIEKLNASGEKAIVLAELGISAKAIQDLEDADFCDPGMVVRLCEYLGVAPPETCPRLK